MAVSLQAMSNGFLVLLILVGGTKTSFAQSKSTSDGVAYFRFDLKQAEPDAANSTITFSEYPLGTPISNQYQKLGIIFGGTSPFIASDESNPTSPVLSGTPQFSGAIKGSFVDPATGTPATVSTFSLDAGYFNDLKSTQLSWYDSAGNLIGSAKNSQMGIQHFSVTSTKPRIASWTIGEVAYEDAGFAIDNVSFDTPTQNSMIILSPPDGSNYVLSASDFRATTPVEFQANPTYAQSTAWNTTLAYHTSAGKGAFSSNDQFTSSGNEQTPKTYMSTGGQLTVAASQGGQTGSVTVTITGTQIPDSEITSRLIGLYGPNTGTPHLMTGIAQHEGVYMQFAAQVLFGTKSLLWPHESGEDGGSHIGLMQMPVNQANAWDWYANTSGGVSLFQEKLATATRRMQSVLSNHTGLAALSAVQLENSALVLYGPDAAYGPYYVPTCAGAVTGKTCSSGWAWSVNQDGNPDGVTYVNLVRSAIH